jgi:protein TonB
VKPTYPPVAAARGLEGHVLVQFDVLSNGTVSNISVVESSHALFERAAIAAARSFRFKARVVDGVPLLSTGVQYQFRFELEH